MSTLLVTFGEIRGWKGAFHAHQFQYRSGWVSKEQHMLIMKHASPRTFLNHYHPLQLDTDIIRVICGLDPDIREKFDEEQAFLDIEAQLSGAAVKEENEHNPSLEDTMHPLQLYLVQSLLSYPVSNSLEDEWHRRDTGAAAVVQYCDVLEGGPLRGRPKQKAPKSASPTGPIAQPKDLQHS
ncbi:hypothetical protein PENSOL_c084G09410 [Penicillium solitum]|uniref:Uncharacterized protein n=1 Tax=Penicillium solitum TaxID=60172 RepID=A0A1V6QDB3_9EURO|nr:uncharacterized protein PENSOL_c084G09410 [Penicillium solitum]OQD86856.1 hypothetical protein PENSOL_c084G09410 [Penicillium solitum]